MQVVLRSPFHFVSVVKMPVLNGKLGTPLQRHRQGLGKRLSSADGHKNGPGTSICTGGGPRPLDKEIYAAHFRQY
jgi:hypothetical protein